MQLSHRSLFLSPLVHTNEVQGMQQAPCLRLLARRARNLLEEGREVLAGRHPSHEPIPEIPLASIGIHWHPLPLIGPMHPSLGQGGPTLGHVGSFHQQQHQKPLGEPQRVLRQRRAGRQDRRAGAVPNGRTSAGGQGLVLGTWPFHASDQCS